MRRVRLSPGRFRRAPQARPRVRDAPAGLAEAESTSLGRREGVLWQRYRRGASLGMTVLLGREPVGARQGSPRAAHDRPQRIEVQPPPGVFGGGASLSERWGRPRYEQQPVAAPEIIRINGPSFIIHRIQ